jgi:transcription antitermination factor NusG
VQHFTLEQQSKKWLAVYTKPRWEKKVNGLLTAKGIETYCPLNKVRKKWSDRTKLVEEPLFKSYVFVHVGEDEQSRVRMTNGVLNYVYWNGKPAIIKDVEIDIIKKFMNEYENVEAHSVNFSPKQRVRVDAGLFMQQEGIVQKVMHNKVEVIIESLGYALVATLDKKNVQPV